MPVDGTAVQRHDADYLDLPFAWTATQRFGHGQVREYQLPLGGDRVAILERVAAKGWALTILHAGGSTKSVRGLFGTPHDALMVLFAEEVDAAFKLGCLRVQLNGKARQAVTVGNSVVKSTPALSPP
jgi:hypothetical protein